MDVGSRMAELNQQSLAAKKDLEEVLVGGASLDPHQMYLVPKRLVPSPTFQYAYGS
jgi:hypothetical protein